MTSDWCRLNGRDLAPVSKVVTVYGTHATQDALRDGVPVAELVRATGLSRARIYQIRDGRR